MRACIIGGGLAGTLLAWRLVQESAGWDIDLVLGEHWQADATTASGGAVRAYEPDPEQRQLAIASMAELLASETLRRWADYREVGAIYRRRSRAGLDAAASDVERVLPGSAHVASLAELEALGWLDGAAIVEHRAGYCSPASLRAAVLADCRRVTVRSGVARSVSPKGAVEVEGQRRDYDRVVVAAGAWTPRLLQSSGLPAHGYRTKSIQYGIYPTVGWRPPHFVDEITGLYGRPAGRADLLLGLPTDEWDVDPERPPSTKALQERAVSIARASFPELALGPARSLITSVDCYCERPTLALRPIVDDRLFTFTGGAGGAVKTALAASRLAATQLAAPATPPPTHQAEAVFVGRGEGQP